MQCSVEEAGRVGGGPGGILGHTQKRQEEVVTHTNIVIKLTMTQPMDMTAGPPTVRPYSKSVVIPVMTLYEGRISVGSEGHPCRSKRSFKLKPFVWQAYNDRKADAKIMEHCPFSLQLLLVPQLGQTVLVL
jgi:hypothetical protein